MKLPNTSIYYAFVYLNLDSFILYYIYYLRLRQMLTVVIFEDLNDEIYFSCQRLMLQLVTIAIHH